MGNKNENVRRDGMNGIIKRRGNGTEREQPTRAGDEWIPSMSRKPFYTC
jgi:hypothetical protein